MMKDTSSAEVTLASGGQQEIAPAGLGPTVYFQFDVDGTVQIDAMIGNQNFKALDVPLVDERATYQLRGITKLRFTETGGAAASVSFRGYAP